MDAATPVGHSTRPPGRRKTARERSDGLADQKRPRRRDQERRPAHRQGYRHPLHSGLADVNEKTAVEMTSLWKPKNGFHRDLEISHRTRDSHIPTSRLLLVMKKEKTTERRMNRRQTESRSEGRRTDLLSERRLQRLHGSLSSSLSASHSALSDQLFRDWDNPSRSVGGITD